MGLELHEGRELANEFAGWRLSSFHEFGQTDLNTRKRISCAVVGFDAYRPSNQVLLEAGQILQSQKLLPCPLIGLST